MGKEGREREGKEGEGRNGERSSLDLVTDISVCR